MASSCQIGPFPREGRSSSCSALKGVECKSMHKCSMTMTMSLSSDSDRAGSTHPPVGTNRARSRPQSWRSIVVRVSPGARVNTLLLRRSLIGLVLLTALADAKKCSVCLQEKSNIHFSNGQLNKFRKNNDAEIKCKVCVLAESAAPAEPPATAQSSTQGSIPKCKFCGKKNRGDFSNSEWTKGRRSKGICTCKGCSIKQKGHAGCAKQLERRKAQAAKADKINRKRLEIDEGREIHFYPGGSGGCVLCKLTQSHTAFKNRRSNADSRGVGTFKINLKDVVQYTGNQMLAILEFVESGKHRLCPKHFVESVKQSVEAVVNGAARLGFTKPDYRLFLKELGDRNPKKLMRQAE